MAFIPLALLIQLLVPKILSPFMLEDEVKEKVRLYSLYMIPTAFLFHLNTIQTKYFTVTGSIASTNTTPAHSQYTPLIASFLGFCAHYNYLVYQHSNETMTFSSIALASFVGQLVRLLMIQIANKCWQGVCQDVKLTDKDVYNIKFHFQDSLRSLARCYGPLAFLDLAMVLACCISTDAILAFIMI